MKLDLKISNTIIRTLIKIEKSLSPKIRILILVIYDLLVVLSSLFLTFKIFLITIENKEIIYLYAGFISVLIYILTGQYKSLTKYFGSRFFYELIFRNFLIVVLISFLLFLITDIRVGSIYYLLTFHIFLTGFSTVMRIFLRDLLLKINFPKNYKRKKVAIYGAGKSGVQLAYSLKLEKNYEIVVFFDKNPTIIGRELFGIPIRSAQEIASYIENIDQILLAIPSLSRFELKNIVNSLEKFDIPLLQIPSLEMIAKDLAKKDALIPIKIEDLLGRDIVLPKPILMAPGVKDKTVCVTGAGGSIGSELCRQILKLKPKKLIVIDQSEYNLYSLIQELDFLNKDNINIKPVLVSVVNFDFIKKLFVSEKVNLVFHSAAYKHVPLVEANPIVGIFNNVISTKLLCLASIGASVDVFLLVSTDKAVRPTNVMGASKRLAELIVQAYSKISLNSERVSNKQLTKFTMVRFGNVLNSSGSVVPLFRKQIEAGGPITITHKNVIRYFMTIEEAANLLIQSALLADGGELFLLDMGSPIKIYDLAKNMIKLSGLKIKNNDNPAGDIEIIVTGLRSGEKLFEELLIDAECKETIHPLIYKANEKFINPESLLPMVDELEKNLLKNDKKRTFKLLKKLVPEWRSDKTQ